MNNKHRHAELMMQYAQDAMETYKPWERWEILHSSRDRWCPIHDNPSWYPSKQYRRKPSTIRIGEYDVPEPVRYHLKRGQKYYTAGVDGESGCSMIWDDDGIDEQWLEANIIYLNKEDAELCSKALRSLLRKKG